MGCAKKRLPFDRFALLGAKPPKVIFQDNVATVKPRLELKCHFCQGFSSGYAVCKRCAALYVER